MKRLLPERSGASLLPKAPQSPALGAIFVFSLILATVDRSKELDQFLTSLEAQTALDFELIVVDQNPKGTLDELLVPYKASFPIKHISQPERGVSKARNVGLKAAAGDVISFSDDDCGYPPWLLDLADRYLREHPETDSVSGQMAHGAPPKDGASAVNAGSGRYLESPLEVAQVPGPWGLFLRRSVTDKIGGFDETLGPGAGTPWGAGEDTDYYLRVVEAGFNLYYNPGIIVYHPRPTQYYANKTDLGRSYRYGAGRTRVWKKHGLPLWYFGYEVARSGAGVALSLLSGRTAKAQWHWSAFWGKLRGWFSRS